MFRNFQGNTAVAKTLFAMTQKERIPQTLLFDGAEGVGKATLVRRFSAALLGGVEKIEGDDLSLETNTDIVAQREKWTSHKRNEDPLLFSTHPDFVTFPPDRPFRPLSNYQIRQLTG